MFGGELDFAEAMTKIYGLVPDDCTAHHAAHYIMHACRFFVVNVGRMPLGCEEGYLQLRRTVQRKDPYLYIVPGGMYFIVQFRANSATQRCHATVILCGMPPISYAPPSPTFFNYVLVATCVISARRPSPEIYTLSREFSFEEGISDVPVIFESCFQGFVAPSEQPHLGSYFASVSMNPMPDHAPPVERSTSGVGRLYLIPIISPPEEDEPDDPQVDPPEELVSCVGDGLQKAKEELRRTGRSESVEGPDD
jgi:hypothetical protein